MERGASFSPEDPPSATELLVRSPARSPVTSPDDHELHYREALATVRALVANDTVAVETIARHADSADTLLSDIAGISPLPADAVRPGAVDSALERWLRRPGDTST